jgi:hypothetical protein
MERFEMQDGGSLRIDGIGEGLIVRMVDGKLHLSHVEDGDATAEIAACDLFEGAPQS